jgi:hypothetical protein
VTTTTDPAQPARPARPAPFKHVPHPRTVAHLFDRTAHAPKTSDERTGVNGRIGLFITLIVGTMWAAYLFTLIALVSLPDVLDQAGYNIGFTFGAGKILIVSWIAQTFLQLVLLPVIIVGQNIQARAADKRSEQTYKDAEAVLHECLEIQRHLQEQDGVLTALIAAVGAKVQPPGSPSTPGSPAAPAS